jgi:glycosyltransferase involved in cell wall biosynthesis
MSGPRVAYVTAGGAGMFCGSCMRDNTLAAALHRMGVDVTLLPTFTPIRTDERDVSLDRVFLGGLNVYLEQRWPWFGRMPRALRRALDRPALLRVLSRLALQRRGELDGAMAVSLLRGEHGRHAAEIRELVAFVAEVLRPDVVNLTNLLIAGFVPALARRHDAPVFVTLQGDDIFLDALPSRARAEVLAEMRRVAAHVDGFVVFNRFYRDHMAHLLGVPTERFHTVPLGLAEPREFEAVGEGGARPPTVGYLARICPEKGFHQLVEAFLRLRRMRGTEHARLRFAGWLGAGERDYLERQLARLRAHGAGDAYERVEVPDRETKIRFLREIDVLSVPTVYREPKGIYVLEALAAGVPVVQPEHGAFPELIAATGGGRLVAPGDAEALAATLHELLLDDGARRELGRRGRAAVLARHDDEAMARETLQVWERGAVRRVDGPAAAVAQGTSSRPASDVASRLRNTTQ